MIWLIDFALRWILSILYFKVNYGAYRGVAYEALLMILMVAGVRDLHLGLLKKTNIVNFNWLLQQRAMTSTNATGVTKPIIHNRILSCSGFTQEFIGIVLFGEFGNLSFLFKVIELLLNLLSKYLDHLIVSLSGYMSAVFQEEYSSQVIFEDTLPNYISNIIWLRIDILLTSITKC